MKPEVKYLLQCYMNNRESESPEVSDQICSLVTSHAKVRRSGSSECREIHTVEDFMLPDDLQRFFQPIAAPNRNLPDGQLNVQERQRIRSLARNLKVIADRLEVKHPRSLLSVERGILRNEDLSAEEMRVINCIHTTRSRSSVSAIADCLSSCLTSRTFRAALRFLSYSATSDLQELAFACQLSSLIMPQVRLFDRSNSIYNAMNDYIESRLESIHDM